MKIFLKKKISQLRRALSPQMARVIRWNVPGLYQQKAHRFLKKITKHADILTRIENGEAVIYENAIPEVILNRYLNK